jgi:hypothetical protein
VPTHNDPDRRPEYIIRRFLGRGRRHTVRETRPGAGIAGSEWSREDTTTVRMMISVFFPTRGWERIAGYDVVRLPEKVQASVLIDTIADQTRIGIGLVLPLLAIAAAVETWVTLVLLISVL